MVADAVWPALSFAVTPYVNVPGTDVSAVIAWLVAPVVHENV